MPMWLRRQFDGTYARADLERRHTARIAGDSGRRIRQPDGSFPERFEETAAHLPSSFVGMVERRQRAQGHELPGTPRREVWIGY